MTRKLTPLPCEADWMAANGSRPCPMCGLDVPRVRRACARCPAEGGRPADHTLHPAEGLVPHGVPGHREVRLLMLPLSAKGSPVTTRLSDASLGKT